MLELYITSYRDGKTVTLSLKGEGTVINSLSTKSHEQHVTNYIMVYKPDKVIFNDDVLREKVNGLLLNNNTYINGTKVIY